MQRGPFYRAAQKAIRTEFHTELDQLLNHRAQHASLAGFYEKRRPAWEALFTAIWRECFIQFGSRFAQDHGAHVLAVKAGETWTYDPWPEGTQRAVRQFVGKKITNVLDATRSAVARVVGQGLEEGHSIEVVAANIRKLYDGFGLRRSFVIARTEVIGASNYGSRHAAQASEAFNAKEWVSTRDSRTREAHRAIDGEIQPFDEPYSNGLMFPGDPSGAAAQVIQCRCVETYTYDKRLEPAKPIEEPLPPPEPSPVEQFLSPEQELLQALSDALKDEPEPEGPPPEIDQTEVEEALAAAVAPKPAPKPRRPKIDPLEDVDVVELSIDEILADVEPIPVEALATPLPPEPPSLSARAQAELDLLTGNHTFVHGDPPPWADLLVELNETEFAGYKYQEGWHDQWAWKNPPVPGQKWTLEANPNNMIDPLKPSGKASAGVIMLEDDGRIWLVEPKDHFGGYEHTFPKGGVEAGATMQQTAIQETWEESGLVPSITSWLGDYQKSTSTSRYYIGRREDGAPWQHDGKESQAVKLVSIEDAEKLLNKSIDKAILKDLKERVAAAKLIVAHPTEIAAVFGPVFSPDTTKLTIHDKLKIMAYREKDALDKAVAEYAAGHIANAMKILEAQGLDPLQLSATVMALAPPPPAPPPPKPAAPAPLPKPDAHLTSYALLQEGNKLNEIADLGGLDKSLLEELAQDFPDPTEFAAKVYSYSGGLEIFDLLLKPAAPLPKVVADDESVKALKLLQERIEKAIEKDLASRVNANQFKRTGPQKGSNPGGEFEHVDTGEAWYIKWPAQPEHAYNEKAAADLYKLAGVNAPEVLLIEDPETGKVGVASKIVKNLKSDPEKLQKPTGKGARTLDKSIADGFAADAWLANWDVVGLGFDNLLIDEKTNQVWRIDAGGSLLYRAQGGEKGSAWNDSAAEWDTLRNKPTGTSSKVFGRFKEEKLVPGLERVAAITDEQIIEAVYAAGWRGEQAEKLVDTLRARRETLAVRMGLKKRSSLLAPTGNYGTIYGGFRTLREAIDKAKNLGGRGDNAQQARQRELESYVGRNAMRKFASVWGSWQGSSAAVEHAFEEWRRLVAGQPPLDAELSRAIAAGYEILQLSLQQLEPEPELMRGVASRTLFKELVAANALGLDYLESSVRTWQSWTTSKHEAKKFMNNAASADAGFLITKKVKKEKIVGGVCMSAGFNQRGQFWDEEEFVVAADDPLLGYSRFPLTEIVQRAWGPGTPYPDFATWRAAKERTPEGKKYIEDAIREFEENQRKRWGTVPKPGQAPPGPAMKARAKPKKMKIPPEGIWEDGDTLAIQERLQAQLQDFRTERRKLLAQGVLGIGAPDVDDDEDWRTINRRADGVVPAPVPLQ